MVYFPARPKSSNEKTLFAWNSLTKELTKVSFEGNEQVKIFDHSMIQVGEALYALQLDGDRPFRFLR